MITTEQFEHKLIEYLDGELSDAEEREVEEYLQAHPEAVELEGDFSLMCAAGRSIRESTFSADLLLEANSKLAARLADLRPENVNSTPVASGNGSLKAAPRRTLQSNWRRRLRPSVLAAALAALAILLVGVVTQRAALASIANSLLQRIVVTFNDEPLSDSQQQAFDELVEIAETLDGNGDQVFTINLSYENLATNQLLQELSDGGVLKVFGGDEIRDAVSSDSDPIMWLKGISGDVDVANLDSLYAAALADSSVTFIYEVGGEVGNLDSLHATLLELWNTISALKDQGANLDSLYVTSLTDSSVTFTYEVGGEVGNLDSPPSAKIGSQSPGVVEDQSWGDIKRTVGPTTDDAP